MRRTMQAAVLVSGVAVALAFSDGNKRLAAALGVIFLRVNGVLVTGDHLELADEVIRLVNHTSARVTSSAALTPRTDAAFLPCPPSTRAFHILSYTSRTN